MSSRDSPSVCVVIVNWNGRELLEACLRSISENTVYENYRVVVVDNGSEDGSVEMVEESFPDVELIANESNRGFSIANNQGIYENPGFDYYALLNNDTEARDGWLTEMLDTSVNHDAGIVGAKLLYPDGTVQHAGGRFDPTGERHIGVGENPESYVTDSEMEFVTGAAMLIDSEVVEDIGYLDEIFTPGYYEDVDYCKRARRAGHVIYFSSDAELVHHESMSKDNSESRFSYFIDRKNFLKHMVVNTRGLELVKHLYVEAKYLGASLIGYGYNPAAEQFRAYEELLEDLPVLVQRRYNRTGFIPPYYSEDIKDYSERY